MYIRVIILDAGQEFLSSGYYSKRYLSMLLRKLQFRIVINDLHIIPFTMWIKHKSNAMVLGFLLFDKMSAFLCQHFNKSNRVT